MSNEERVLFFLLRVGDIVVCGCVLIGCVVSCALFDLSEIVNNYKLILGQITSPNRPSIRTTGDVGNSLLTNVCCFVFLPEIIRATVVFSA